MKPEDIARERAKWRWVGSERPSFALPTGPGEESVWDYPRPPRVERVSKRVRVELAGEVVADSTRAQRVVETAAPPVYYIPPEDVRTELLRPELGSSFCEWKGDASYFSLASLDEPVERAAWCYRDPEPGYAAIGGHLAFRAVPALACFVGAARAAPQPGDYYGGWITPGIVGPFKGDPGTEAW